MRELEKKKEMVRRHYIDGKPLRSDLPFHEYATEWYKLRKEPFISDASRSAYKTALTKHILPVFGLRHLRAITSAELQAFINSFAGSSKSQITVMVGIIKAVMQGAYEEGIIEHDPSVALIRPRAKKKNERRALTKKETRNVLATIERHPDGLLLAVLYYLGLRRGEALGLRWEDFDFEENMVHIQRDIDFAGNGSHDGDLKTAATNRFVPIPEELRAMLIKLRSLPGQYVFHMAGDPTKPLAQSTYKRKWVSLMKDACCVEDRPVFPDTNRPNDILKRLKPTLTPHYFRHNYVTLLYEAGVDPLIAMKFVGHTDYQTTANIYTHLSNETMRKARLNIDGVFAGKGDPGSSPNQRTPFPFIGQQSFRLNNG